MYLAKGFADTALQDLLATVLDTPNLQDGAELYDYHHILGVAGGFARHYLQYELTT